MVIFPRVLLIFTVVLVCITHFQSGDCFSVFFHPVAHGIRTFLFFDLLTLARVTGDAYFYLQYVCVRFSNTPFLVVLSFRKFLVNVTIFHFRWYSCLVTFNFMFDNLHLGPSLYCSYVVLLNRTCFVGFYPDVPCTHYTSIEDTCMFFGTSYLGHGSTFK